MDNMAQPQNIFLKLLILLTASFAVHGYNLDLRIESAKFMTSPVLEALGRSKSGSLVPELDPSIPPSFYGYDMNMIKPTGSNSQPRLMVGAPKMTDPSNPRDQRKPTKPKIDEQPEFKPHGAVKSCPVQNSFFDSSRNAQPTCSPANPSPSQPGDGFGASLAATPEGDMSACTTARALECTIDNYSPGYCYASEDQGVQWRKDGGTQNTECPETTVDVLFVLDGSGSVYGHFDTVKRWVKNIVKQLSSQMRQGYIKVGVVQYSHYFDTKPWSGQKYVKTEIEIGQFRLFSDFSKAMDKIKHQNYTTFTGRALEKVVGDFNSTSTFGRKNNKQMMFLMTDGKSSDPDLVPKNARALRRMGVTTFAVGVGNADPDELGIIATGRKKSKERVYSVRGFDQLDSLVKRLKTNILKFVLEGGGSSQKATYKLEQAQTGFSSAFEERPNGRLYLGAVGAYDWSGTVTKYDSVDDQQPDIPGYTEVQKVLPDRTKESYMGYSVTTGYFLNEREEYVATGAPRYKLMGAVVVYKPLNSDAKFNNHVTLTGNKKQLGSYFGGSVLAEDVNADGLDDLFVGAPLYVDQNYDEGRVFVFLSQLGKGSLEYWSGNYEPLELSGDDLPGGRFGTAIASAGDLNMDGYNDIIVGAPLTEGDRGAVFVYHGSSTGMDTTFKQKILASEMTGVTLKYFGQSLQGGVDLDGNKYPDIAVGAPKSDTVVIFRSRPVVKITAEIEYKTSDIDIFECIDKKYENCTVVEVCFTADGTSVEDQIGIKFNVTMDSGKVGADKRLEFREGQENPKSTWSEEYQLNKASKKCFQKDVHMKRAVKDYDAKIMADVEYDLLPSHTAKPLSSVRDPSIPNKKSAVLNFVKSCGGDGCVYNLRIDASLVLPKYTTEKNKDLTEGGKVLVVDQTTADTPVTVKVNLSNHGENAFDTRIQIEYTSSISLREIKNRIGFPPSNSCVVEDTDPVDVAGGRKRQILRYNYKTNIMRPNAWCYFEFGLNTNNLRKNGALKNFSVSVNAYTNDSSDTSKEIDVSDNSWGSWPEVRYRSDFTLKERRQSSPISFNYTTEAANITSVTQIGNGTTDIKMEFEINGHGYSNIPNLDASLVYPMKTKKGDILLYLYKVDCEPKEGKSSCSCDQSLINSYNLTLEAPNENNTNGSYVEITPPQYPIEASSFDCFTAGEKNLTCETLKCTINDLYQSDQIIFKAYFRLWSSAITFNGSGFGTDELELHSLFRVDTNKSNYIINGSGDRPLSESKEVITTAKKYTKPVPPELTKDLLWVYILAAIGGLLLLIVLVIILWKVGFFKSKYADMKKDAQDDLADETEFPQNGDGSQADMVD